MDNEQEYEALRDETIPDLIAMIIELRERVMDLEYRVAVLTP